MFSTLMPMIMMSKGGLGSDSTNSLLPLLLMSMGKYRGRSHALTVASILGQFCTQTKIAQN